MYVGQYQPVQIPKCGKLHIQKNGYVYLSNASVWNNEKKRSIDNRVSIGKVIPDLPGMMYPNKKYFDIFGDDSNSRENTMTGNMITNLNIENFRGIQKLSIKEMRRLVLLSGNNNVGKSSVLEAVFLMMDHLSPDSFSRMNGFRGLNIPTNGVSLWEPLFYQMNPDNTIRIQAKRGEDTLTLSYAKDDSYIPALNGGIPKNVAGSFQSSAKRNYTLRFDFQVEGSADYSEIGHYTASENGMLRELADDDGDKQVMQLSYTSFVNNNFVRTDRAILDRMGKAEINGEKEKLIHFLNRIDSSISDIVTLSTNGIPQLYINTNRKLLPVQFSGDGINKLLYIVLSIMDARDGILLIDEIDTGFHYSMYEDLWKIVSDVSRDYNCQVIATTHSYENIMGAVEGVKDYPEDFSFYRLGYTRNGIESFRYSYDLLKNALRSDMEVR
ncbi:MAG: AAA family ATPase [Thermoguttaceae bacterium]|nr:AAA family ATPase [Thermoguttaceae bacterium]MCR5360023.1 AAA family ATPase [Thermoguttaceae bacterium]